MRYRSTIASFALAVLAAMSSFCSHAGLTSTWHLPANGLDPSALVYASAPVGAPQIPYINLAVRIPAGRTLRLRIGVKGGKAPKDVFVNSRPCVYLKNEQCVPAFTSDPLCVYEVPHYEEDAAVVEILTNTPVELSHLDLQVRPKKGL